MSTNFSLTTASPQVNVIQSINYLLATQPNIAAINSNSSVVIGNTIVQANTTTGQVYTQAQGTISYLYGFMDVAYANTATGGGFTSNCFNTQYYGLRNTSSPVWDSNPTDYQWYQVAGGFGTTKGLYYQNNGGNSTYFAVGSVAPSINYSPVLDGIPIVLATLANSIVVANTIQPAAITNVQIASNTIQGTNIQTGTITANLLAANIIFVNQSIQSTNATFDSPTSAGFWLDASNGSARFGGNTSIGSSLTVGNNAVIGGNLSVGSNVKIGNNLTVGNNAVIGGNLNVQGLITTSNLNVNVVSTTTIVPFNVSTSIYQTTSVTQSNSYSSAPAGEFYYSSLIPSLTTTSNNQQVLVSSSLFYYMNATYVSGGPPLSTLTTLFMSFYNAGTLVYYQLGSAWNNPVPFWTNDGTYYGVVNFTELVTLPTVGMPVGTTYYFQLGLSVQRPTTAGTITFQGGSMSIQNLLR
jgi:carbonic anhydrase/acetyltransferase-like protein (isoleucine patch superfamily)